MPSDPLESTPKIDLGQGLAAWNSLKEVLPRGFTSIRRCILMRTAYYARKLKSADVDQRGKLSSVTKVGANHGRYLYGTGVTSSCKIFFKENPERILA